MFRHIQSKEKVMYLKGFVNGSLKWRSSQHTVSVLTTNVNLANSDEYENYLKREGTKHELTIHAEQNDITKRFNSILMEMVRSISGDSQLPKSS